MTWRRRTTASKTNSASKATNSSSRFLSGTRKSTPTKPCVRSALRMRRLLRWTTNLTEHMAVGVAVLCATKPFKSRRTLVTITSRIRRVLGVKRSCCFGSLKNMQWQRILGEEDYQKWVEWNKPTYPQFVGMDEL